MQGAWNDTSKVASIVEEMHTKLPNDWTFLPGLSKEDKEHFVSGIRRADEFGILFRTFMSFHCEMHSFENCNVLNNLIYNVVNHAKELGVKILVDAEFYACKDAISTIALVLMAKYNRDTYVVGDTIQGYLKVGGLGFPKHCLMPDLLGMNNLSNLRYPETGCQTNR